MIIMNLNNLFLYMFIYVCVLLTERTKVVISFNIEENEPVFKKPPIDNGDNSYFGFSVELHQESPKTNWILVGAPLGKNLQPNSNRSGALYKCPITQDHPDDCEQVKTDGSRIQEFDYEDESEGNDNMLYPAGSDEIKTGQWLGVTVKSEKPGGSVVVCAHRYTQKNVADTAHYGYGLCYLLSPNLTTTNEYQPCKGRPVDRLHQQFGLCQVGTSLAFFEDGTAMMGAPGPYTWRGTIFGIQMTGDYVRRDKTIYHGPLNDNPTPLDKYSYMGMSVTGGKFFNKNLITYASGAPRSQMKGQVFFLEKLKGMEEMSMRKEVLTGLQFGSGFGYEILSVDINRDGFDDLLVGAPFYYDENHGGAVYVYMNLTRCFETCNYQAFYGMLQSRFGFAMTSLGDINKDGYNDVAIGAPYEENKGAVYIYLGSATGLHEEPSQIIRLNSLTTFGYSLSGGLDVDGNEYPDLLVGAYESERAILFKTRPIIDINIKIKGRELNNINTTLKGCPADRKSNNTCFSFQSCFEISGIKRKTKTIIKYHVKEIGKYLRVWFKHRKYPDIKHPEREERITVRDSSQEYCINETVYIKEGISDILTPIKFSANYALDNVENLSPVLNKTTAIKYFQANFQKHCGSDDKCESKLILHLKTDLKQENGSYIVDNTTNDFILQANVSNKGEPAYESKLFIKHPDSLSYIALKGQTNVKCSVYNKTLIICDLGNPLGDNKKVALQLRFEIDKNTKLQTLLIKSFVNSTSHELSNKTSDNISVILRKTAQFKITGKSTANIFYGGKVIGESAVKIFDDIGSKVSHKIQVENTGEWSLDISVTIPFPYQIWQPNEKLPGKWLLYLEELPKVTDATGHCEVTPPTAVNSLNLTETPSNSSNPELPSDPNLSKYELSNFVIETQDIKKGGKPKKIVTMECGIKSAKCAEIKCLISSFQQGTTANIEIRSRIWNSTFVSDYSHVDWVVIKTTANVALGPGSPLTLDKTSIDSVLLETVAYPDNISQSSHINMWWIVVAVVAGLIVLLVFTVILWWCGFFKRNRISKDPTLSGHVVEQDSLLREKN